MTRPTELRTYHDMWQQIELERMLAARRSAEAARAERFRTLPTPSLSQGYTPADETDAARKDFLLALIVATVSAPVVWMLTRWLLPIVWSAK